MWKNGIVKNFRAQHPKSPEDALENLMGLIGPLKVNSKQLAVAYIPLHEPKVYEVIPIA